MHPYPGNDILELFQQTTGRTMEIVIHQFQNVRRPFWEKNFKEFRDFLTYVNNARKYSLMSISESDDDNKRQFKELAIHPSLWNNYVQLVMEDGRHR